MTTERLTYLLEKWHLDQMTEYELAELEQWYQQVQDNQSLLYDGKDIERENLLKQEMTAQLMEKLGAELLKRSDNKRYLIQRWTVAAAILLAAFTMFYKNYLTGKGNNRIEVEIASLVVGDSAKSPMVYLRNSTKEKRIHYLQDSSKVVLSPNSEISYDSHFSNGKREINLHGEALFNVKNSYKSPFSVSANGIKVFALGTSFTVTAYKKDSIMEVMLYEGKVLIKSDSSLSAKAMKPVYLKPGDLLQIHPVTLVNLINRFNTKKEKHNSIADKSTVKESIITTIRFEQETLSSVFNKLATHYATTIFYNNEEIKDFDFSGVIRSSDSVGIVLQRIAILNDLSVTKTNNRYTISKN